MVIGGGISGMAAALSLANQGYETHIVEQSDRLGGQALNLFRTADGEDVGARLRQMVAGVEQNDNIRVHFHSTLSKVDGFVGSFTSTLTAGDMQTTIDHGVTVVATGASPLVPNEYGYGSSAKILTSLELDRRFIEKDPALETVNTAVFIQCVGSRETERPYCSGSAAPTSIDNALLLKKHNPEMNVFILYRDIRTYGEREYLYKSAREKGIIFIRYEVGRQAASQGGRGYGQRHGNGSCARPSDRDRNRPVDPGHRHCAARKRGPGPVFQDPGQ